MGVDTGLAGVGAGAGLQTICCEVVVGWLGRRVEEGTGHKGWQRVEQCAAAGAEGKDQSHRLSPREQLRWSVGGRRGRDGGVTRHIEKKVLHQWQWCHSSK